MKRAALGLAGAAALLMLVACGEKPQTNDQGVKFDSPVQSGSGPQTNGTTAFTAAGYKPGDKKIWTEQIRTRMQYGQNEYSREN